MSAAPADPGLTVVVPCFNDGESLHRVHAEITTALSGIDDLEILLVDDGSRDDTLTQMRALAARDPRVRYLSFTRNFGLEAAQAAAFRYASKPWTAQLDSDLQNPPEEIWKLLDTAKDGYDVVFGIREQRQDPLVRRWGSLAQRWLARRGFGIDLPPGASTFRVLRTGVARTLADLRLGSPYFIAMVPLVGARYACVKTAHRRDQGRSRWRVTRLVGHSFELLFGYSWRPLNGTYLLGALGAVGAVLLAAMALAGFTGAVATGSAALLLGAANLVAIALVGRYLHRLMLDQRRTRPYYIREANVPLRPEDRFDGGESSVPPPGARASDRGTVLILGASEDQLPVYVEARRRGYRTIAVDWWTDRPALPHADEHLQLSTRDHSGIAAALGDRALTGVIAAASDVSLESWHELSVRYGTPYRYPLSAARASIDKAAFHAMAESAGVTGYRWRTHTDRKQLLALADDLGFPLVAKPVDSSGSKGVTLVTRPEQLPAALDYAAGYTVTGELIVEEYLPGRNLTVDVFLRDGHLEFTGITEKRVVPGPHFIIGGHTCPAPIDDEVRGRLAETAARLCRAIGLTDGPANFDVILGRDGSIRVLEANARLCGNAFPLLMREVYGVDTVAALVSMALGEPFDLTPTRAGAGIIHVLASPLSVDGVLAEVAGLDEVRALPGVARCEVYQRPGAIVHPFTQAGHKFGYLLVTGPDVAAAEATLATALQLLRIRIRAADPESPAPSGPPPPSTLPPAAPYAEPPLVDGVTHAAP
jgi:biotin carboxylase